MIFQNNIGTVEEATGQRLDAAIAVSSNGHEIPLAYYLLLRVGGEWHRLTLDEGVLFLEPARGVSDSCFGDAEDVFHHLPIPEGVILEFVVRRGEALVRLRGGEVLVVTEDPLRSMLSPTVLHSV